MLKNLVILGSTGSIGTQTLDVVRKFPERLAVIGLAAGHNARLLSEQVAEFQPRFLSSQANLVIPDCTPLSPENMVALPEVDIVVVATSGNTALMSVLAAIRADKIVALSNKESLVSAGDIILSEAAKSRSEIRPVDSEHSAIWQCLAGERAAPARLILTASGGPFRGYPQDELSAVTAAQALRHPSWKMGDKITIDSASLMNKGLEVIEAHFLFNMPYEKIEVVIHPESIIHSLVEFGDGTLKAQLSYPDMRMPIQYALSYPDRWSNDDLQQLDLIRINHLNFETPDNASFPCLRLAIEAGKKAGTYPSVLCAADEVVVGLFMDGIIKFTDFGPIIREVLDAHQPTSRPKIEDILAADRWARIATKQVIEKARMSC